MPVLNRRRLWHEAMTATALSREPDVPASTFCCASNAPPVLTKSNRRNNVAVMHICRRPPTRRPCAAWLKRRAVETTRGKPTDNMSRHGARNFVTVFGKPVGMGRRSIAAARPALSTKALRGSGLGPPNIKGIATICCADISGRLSVFVNGRRPTR